MKGVVDVELLVVMVLWVSGLGVSEECRIAGEVRCAGQDKCVPVRYICDNDPDCSDNSDEEPQLCRAWRTRCGRGEVPCGEGEGDCVPIADYCDNHTRCDSDLDLRICQMLRDQRLQRLATVILRDFGPRNNFEESEAREEEFNAVLNFTLSHPECPPLHTLVGDQCLAVFFPAAVSWGEGRGLCRLLGGDLLTSTNLTHFSGLLDHLRTHRMTVDFWVGGRYVNTSLGWAWLDHNPMDLGSPLWAVRHYNTCQTRNITFPENSGRIRAANDGVCYHYQQAPQQHQQEVPEEGWCAALTYRHYYYLSDEDCLSRKSPICVHEGGHRQSDEAGNGEEKDEIFLSDFL